MGFYEVFLLILDVGKIEEDADKVSLFLSASSRIPDCLTLQFLYGSTLEKLMESGCIPVKVWTVLKV